MVTIKYQIDQVLVSNIPLELNMSFIQTTKKKESKSHNYFRPIIIFTKDRKEK